MLAGIPLWTLPRSSGCSRRDLIHLFLAFSELAAANARKLKWMNSFPFSALIWSLRNALGKPHGNSLLLQGCGGLSSAQLALDHVLHGGLKICTSK